MRQIFRSKVTAVIFLRLLWQGLFPPWNEDHSGPVEVRPSLNSEGLLRPGQNLLTVLISIEIPSRL